MLDVQLPGLDGLALQKRLTEEGRMEQIVFITGHGDIPMGIGAMKRRRGVSLPRPSSTRPRGVSAAQTEFFFRSAKPRFRSWGNRVRARRRAYGGSEVIRKLGPKLPGFQFWSVRDPRL